MIHTDDTHDLCSPVNIHLEDRVAADVTRPTLNVVRAIPKAVTYSTARTDLLIQDKPDIYTAFLLTKSMINQIGTRTELSKTLFFSQVPPELLTYSRRWH